MKELFQTVVHELEKQRAVVLVTVIASSGSVPRGAGSRMMVREDGSIFGTIGGGAVEYRAMGIAGQALEKRISSVEAFVLKRSEVSGLGMICGGEATVFFQYIDPSKEEHKEFFAGLLSFFEDNEDSWLMLDMTGKDSWQMGAYSRKRAAGAPLPKKVLAKLGTARAFRTEAEGHKYYLEPLTQAGTVYIFGGGHVARELVPLLAHLNFRCVVMDDRKEFANPALFPRAAETIVGDMGRIGDYVRVGEKDYVCVMTRGHEFDYQIQRQMLKAGPRYIGVMGSRNKIRVVTEKLLAEGFRQEEIEACHMPIGTEIYAETPSEIAVSIAGELIAQRSRKKPGKD